MKNITPPVSTKAIHGALKQLLRPLVKLLIHFHVTLPALRELLKSIYVEVAEDIIRSDGHDPNHSRIYILTGVHRKDIKRIQLQAGEQQSTTTSPSLGGELIARWTAMPEFLTDQGSPRQLTKSGLNDEPGFEQLVTSVSKDIRPRAMLDEWLRQGLVSMHEDRVVLNENAFVPSEDYDELFYYLGRNIRDHLASSTFNLLKEGPPMLERSVYYANLSEQSVQFLRDVASTQGKKLLSDINKKAMRMHQQDKGRADATHRFTLGAYWYQQDNRP